MAMGNNEVAATRMGLTKLSDMSGKFVAGFDAGLMRVAFRPFKYVEVRVPPMPDKSLGNLAPKRRAFFRPSCAARVGAMNECDDNWIAVGENLMETDWVNALNRTERCLHACPPFRLVGCA